MIKRCSKVYYKISPIAINGFLVSYLTAWPIQIARMPVRWKMTDPENKQSGKTKTKTKGGMKEAKWKDIMEMKARMVLL